MEIHPGKPQLPGFFENWGGGGGGGGGVIDNTAEGGGCGTKHKN